MSHFIWYLFYLFIFFFSSLTLFSPPHLQQTLSLALFQSPPHTLFSSLSLPREKRFCLLLVSAPSQSAFLISSYCFCLIFKCYPGPNGNPYKKDGEGKKERMRNRLGIVFHSRSPRQKPPLGERFGGLGGVRGRRMGLKYNPRGDTFLWCFSTRTATSSFLIFLPLFLSFFFCALIHPTFHKYTNFSPALLISSG